MGKDTLAKTLKIMNFTYGKVDRKSILIDRYEIVVWRMEFLRKIRMFRNERKKIYYTDETWVNEGHTVKKVWQDGNVKNTRQATIEGWTIGLKMPSGKSRRLIITHIGSGTGFLANGELIFQSKKTEDYHEEMNGEVYEKWFDRVVQDLEPGSDVVMDNASYHSRKCERLYNHGGKQEFKNGYVAGIPYEETYLKTELLKIAKIHAHKFNL
ncbi:hypothetical protein NQ315_011666 [Exocentrus adspersus]|uniref:Tc1-like transposase DDE domain-containing protein n=1 Tax=Exocentrus adspersus TaxID=1586481 RepID=A0AAV8V531_9CUCU|nr:hypothetical protein NQ315_011666 [Exocentrus adspersus]